MDDGLRHYSVAEIAEMTGLPARSIADDLRYRGVKHVRHAGKRWMTMPQIKAWLRSKEQVGTAIPRPMLSADELDRRRAARRTRRAA